MSRKYHCCCWDNQTEDCVYLLKQRGESTLWTGSHLATELVLNKIQADFEMDRERNFDIQNDHKHYKYYAKEVKE